MKKINMITEVSCEEFRSTGLFWLVNSILHAFGYVIVMEMGKGGDGKFIRMYPARTRYRGFTEKGSFEGYEKVAAYMRDNANELYEEAGYGEEE